MGMKLIFLVVAIVLFILAGLGVGSPRVNIGWFGLAFFAAAFIV
jgi:hypothetical protein